MKKYVNTTILSLLFISIGLNISSFSFIFNQEKRIQSVREFIENKKKEYSDLGNEKIMQEIIDNKIKEIKQGIENLSSTGIEIKYNIIDLSDIYKKFYEGVKLYGFETKDNQNILDRIKQQLYLTEIKIQDNYFIEIGIPEHLQSLCNIHGFLYCLTFKTIEGGNSSYTKMNLSGIPTKEEISEIIKELKNDNNKGLFYINSKLNSFKEQNYKPSIKMGD